MAATVKQLTQVQLAKEYLGQHTEDTMYARNSWYRYLDGVWTATHDQIISHEIWTLMERWENVGQLRANLTTKGGILDKLRASLFVPHDKVDELSNLINMANGVYSLDDDRLYPHDPGYHFTTQLPFAYDQNAAAPLWQKYLITTLVQPRTTTFDPELHDFLQEAIGYSLTTDVSYHISFYCRGEGENGKGVLFHILYKLGGSAAIALNIGTLKRERYQLATLFGKKIAICSESNSTDNLVEDADVKSLIAGDLMPVRMIHREPLTLNPKVKLWWSMNDLPPVADTSHGFWRRVRVIPFNRIFDGADRDMYLKEKLESELSGIFNWAMAGLRRLRQKGAFTQPEQVSDATLKYRRESNPVQAFVDDMCIVGPTFEYKSSDAYHEYHGWCKANGYKPLSDRNFKREMERLKFYYTRRSHPCRRVFDGLRPVEPIDLI